MQNNKKNIIYIVLLTIVPILFGLPFAISMNKMEIVEVVLIVTGCLELMAFTLRIGRREKKNIKKYYRYKSHEEDEGFAEYRSLQNMLLISGIVNIIVSVVWFYISL